MSTFFRDGTDDHGRQEARPAARRIWTGIPVLAFLLAGTAASAPPRPDSAFVDPGIPPRVERIRDYDLLHTALDLRVDWDRRAVSGSATHRLTPLGRPLSEVHFDQHALTFLGAGHAGGAALEWRTTGDTVTVVLERPYRPGEELELVLRYEAVDPVAGIYFKLPDDERPRRFANIWTQGQAEETHYWFPTYDSPNEVATGEQRITVERRFTVAGNGALVERRANPDGTDTWHYRLDVPFAPYLTALVVGEYEVVAAAARGVPILSYVRPELLPWAHRSFSRTGEMLALYEDLSSTPYPYPAYRQAEVEEYLFGGMENAALSVLMSSTLHDRVAAENYDSYELVSHEISHQWFGDYVNCRTWDHTWLNEGFATYCEILFFEYGGHPERAAWELEGYRRGYLAEDEAYRRPMVTPYYGHPDDMFDSVGYGKGAAVLHMLRRRLGDEGFGELLRRWLDLGPGPVDTADLQRVAEAVAGGSLERFFHQWTVRGGHPEFAVSWRWDPLPGEAVVTVRQVQGVDALTPYFRVPVALDFTGAGWHRRREVWAQGPDQEFRVPLPSLPDLVEFDREGHVVSEVEFTKDAVMWRRQLAGSPALLSRARAALALVEHPGPATTRALTARLFDEGEYWAVRGEAARALARLGGDEAREALLKALDDPSARVRTAVFEALGELADPATVPRLLLAVRTDPSYHAAAAAVEAAGSMKVEGSFDVVRAALARPTWRRMIQVEAIRAARSLSDSRALEWILPFTAESEPVSLRSTALSASGRLASLLDDDHPRRRLVRGLLADALDSDTVQIRLAAVRGLSSLGSSSRDLLEPVAARDEHPMVARTVRSVLEGLEPVAVESRRGGADASPAPGDGPLD